MAMAVMSSVSIPPSSLSHRFLASRAKALTASATRARPNAMRGLMASAFLMNSQTPSEQHKRHASASSTKRLKLGTCMTPTECAMRSPKARDMASPGASLPRQKTRCGKSFCRRTTSPPEPMMRRLSSGSCGLWSAVAATSSTLAFEELVGDGGDEGDDGLLALPAPPVARAQTQRESPVQATSTCWLLRSMMATESVVPLNATSKPSQSASYLIALCTRSNICATTSSCGRPSAPASSSSKSRNIARAAK
mmetsp:Transcript_73327/g.184812  ORF Transcript_73327/g.184812 Transcript_73327/m.184812 type:complete len:251 (+) Transcript_73327:189-941(+)